MRRKSSKRRRSKTVTDSLNGKRDATKVVEKIVQIFHRTPKKSSDYERYLQDEKWDILPKTDYTYARTGSYSPRFLGRKWVDPNMSRYRIRYKGGARSDVDYDGYLSSEYSEDERLASEDIQDSDSDVSYERVLVDGIELRSGKNLKTMREILHEHDAKLQQSEIMQSTNRHAYTTSKLETKTRARSDGYNENTNARTRSTSKKLAKQQGNQNRVSQSEQKHGRYSDAGYYRHGDFEYGNVDYSGVRSRRNLSTDFYNSTNRVQNKSNGLDMNVHKSNSDHDEVDNRLSRSGYSLRTVTTKTLTEEFFDSDRDVTEKGSVEASEKATRAGRTSKVHNVNLYGLDPDGEFSDTDTVSTKQSSIGTSSNSRYGEYSDHSTGSTSTVTTVVTTITETVSIFTNPVWNHVGKPVRDHVVRPFTSTVMSVLFFTWLLLTRPVIYIVESVCQLWSWLWSSKFEEIIGGVARSPFYFLRKIKQLSWQLILMDSWLFKRRNGRRCCLCLPLLLLLPFLLMFLTGYDMWSDRTSLLNFFKQDKAFVPVVPLADSEKHDYFTQLNTEVKNMILQLQTNQQREQLTAADVEAIVYRIVAKENADLKSNLQGSRNEALVNQAQWKLEQDAKLEDMQQRHDMLIASIHDLENSIAKQKVLIAEKDSTMNEDAAQNLAALEEKLAALHVELQDLEKAHAALLTRVNACCHNETYYAAAVKENVNIILAQMMSGHMSGNPSQDAFTEWLHSNYVSREVLDERLKDLASDLTTNVLAMIKELQDAQLKQYQHLEEQQLQLQNSQQTVHLSASGAGVGEQQVRQMIEDALFRYSADKTGIADYALESAGGVVISTRCSESYYRKTALVSVFGVPLWYTSNSPRTVIQPEVYPGQCWAFKGVEGYLVIKTSTTITPSGFTLEHIPKSLAPSGEIESAPKDFTVLGLQSEYDDNGVYLGNYTYDDNGKPMQFFPVQIKEDLKPFNLYELKIRSNYGNVEYTCLYRFRIHGKPYRR